ncbi:MAG: MFS transporter [Bacteroidota bacterium]
MQGSAQNLPYSRLIAYSFGMMGWSVLVNMIGVLLIYFYLPPSNSGMVNLLSQAMILGVLNLPSLITAAGRLVDAVYDPFIGQLSDRSANPQGRRIPFMKLSVLPSVVFCALVFLPLDRSESASNAIWLTVTLILFFVSATTYIIPYNALMPEMAHTAADKVRFSTYQQVGFVMGIVMASATNNIADLVQNGLGISDRMQAVQYAIWGLCGLGGVLMLIPVLAIDERKYCRGKPSHTPLIAAIRHSFRNKNFVYYIAADFSYYMAMYIITSGLLYFLTVLCGGPESEGVLLMGTMVGVSLLFYPFINLFANRIGKKKIVLFSFAMLALLFLGIYYLGKFPMDKVGQMYLLVIGASLPLASLGILPPAILAEIAEEDAQRTGENREGLYFAVKYFVVKLGQTFGIALFAFLTLYGKDPGNDLGLRLNGICGFVLCAVAFIAFSKFKEKG